MSRRKAKHSVVRTLFGKPRSKIVKRPGALRAKARAAGQSTQAYARSHQHSPGRTGKQARLALTFAKMRSAKHKASRAHRQRKMSRS